MKFFALIPVLMLAKATVLESCVGSDGLCYGSDQDCKRSDGTTGSCKTNSNLTCGCGKK